MSEKQVQFTDSGAATDATFIKLKPLNDEQKEKGFYRQLEEGQAIEGILKKAGPITSKFGTKNQYVIEEFVTGANVVIEQAGNLTARLEGKNVKVGDAVQINYLGKSPLKSGPFAGTPAHNFRVETEAT